MGAEWGGRGRRQGFPRGHNRTRTPTFSFPAFGLPVSPATHRLPVEQQLQHRNGISGRLPRASAGPSQEVLPLQGQRDGLFLDQRGPRPAQVGDGLGETRGGPGGALPYRRPRHAGRLLSPPGTCRSRGSRPMCSNPNTSGSAMLGLRSDSAQERKEERDDVWAGQSNNQSALEEPSPPGSTGA